MKKNRITLLYVKLKLEGMLNDLGAPTMTYAPTVEIKELRKKIQRANGQLLSLWEEIEKAV